MTKPKQKRGRPSKFTDALASEIIRRLSDGEPLAQICRLKKMPDCSTVWDWEQKYPQFSQGIARARKLGFDCIAADALRIADTPVEGLIKKQTEKGLEVTREDMLGHRRLQVETRLKLLAKWDPKRYGEKLEVENSGETKITIRIGGDDAARG